MYLVNKNYVLIDKLDIFLYLSILANNDSLMLNYLNDMLKIVLDYERDTHIFVEGLYIKKDSLFIEELLASRVLEKSRANKEVVSNELSIDRSIILNASLFALYKKDFEMAEKLSAFFDKDEVILSELGDLADYVLLHSISINEYFNKEKERIIYDFQNKVIYKGYIYSDTGESLKRKRS